MTTSSRREAAGADLQRDERRWPIDASTDAFDCDRGAVRTVVADDDGRSLLVRFGASDGFDVDQADLAASHQCWPSAVVVSHSALSPLVSHSAQAPSYACPSSDARKSLTAPGGGLPIWRQALPLGVGVVGLDTIVREGSR